MNNWYQHDALNKSYLTEQLYGSRERNYTGKFSRKLKGEEGKFNFDEKMMLMEIRQKLLQELSKTDQQLAALCEELRLPDEKYNLQAGLILSDSERLIQALQKMLGGTITEIEFTYILDLP